MKKLEGKTAVITGASSGIGEAIALLFADSGANVIINYCHSKDKANGVKQKIESQQGNARIVQADVSEPEQIDWLIQQAENNYGQVDIWVNNAGADILTGIGATLSRDEKLAELIRVDLNGTINACWKIAPLMKAQGRGVIINNSWDLATHGFHGLNPQMFAATKAGILGFSRCLAHDYAPEVRVNIISPGWVMTAFAENDMQTDYLQQRISEIPLGRFGQPDDIANAALFLASDDAEYITGEEIRINGGLI